MQHNGASGSSMCDGGGGGRERLSPSRSSLPAATSRVRRFIQERRTLPLPRVMVVFSAAGDSEKPSDATEAGSQGTDDDDFRKPAASHAWSKPALSPPEAGQEQEFPEVISLNVGGTYFTTRLSTLRRYDDTMLAAMFSGRHHIPRDAEGRFFIDRDGAYFGQSGAHRGDRQAEGHAEESALRQAEGVRLQGGDAHHAVRAAALQLAALRALGRRGQALRAPLRGGRVLRALGGGGRRLRPAALHRGRPGRARHRRRAAVHRRVRQAPHQPLLLQETHLRVQDHLVVTPHCFTFKVAYLQLSPAFLVIPARPLLPHLLSSIHCCWSLSQLTLRTRGGVTL
ncbi:BTB/POZ domain-containing protein KCTD7 isoform X2 [Entelurus aequoreus]|uniref:BTB/POZ domain-containing protein KCTD7 isoform X2 n=1 Tax=Entelurus aequoreus TaxID=161455 RepID=UPI002B1DDC9A|nr:BTB/POZ domain-containing protein KCTD7 isoform X2 [Entelurus aequoreus]